jgi:hypothetical protein
MAYTKYSLTPANNTAAPPDGAPEGMLPSAVNDTMRDMMAQIRDVGDGIRDGTYTMTAAKITGGSITGITFSSIVVTGGSITGATVTSNTFSSSGATITGGSINGTAVGASTASTGAFTTLGATGNTNLDGGTFVFNDSGADKDFRIEGDTDANLFFTDASTDRIGIGTSSPAVKLDAVVTGNSLNSIIAARNTTSGTAAGSQILVGNDSSNDLLVLRALSSTYTSSGVNTANGSLIRAGGAGGMTLAATDGSGIINFATGGTTERMRIDSSGQVFVGQTSGSGANEIFGVGTSSDATAVAFRTTNTGQTSDIALFRANRNTTNGSFRALAYYNDAAGAYRFWVLDSGNCQNTNGSYGAFSDIKLKENISDATPKLEDLSKVRVVSYNLKSNPTEKHIGVIAQELEQVFPAMVEEIADKDADNNNLGTTTKSVKYSIFVPMLIKAIQELKAELDATKAEVQALKGVS